MSKVLLMIRELGNNTRSSVLIKVCIAVLLAAVLTFGIITVSYSDSVNKGLADNLIRLHVIANSDSEEDQALKRDVRDVIIAYMKEQLKDSKDIEQTKFIINSRMDNISRVASDEIEKHGKAYNVKATMGSFPFPTKAYGDITLPAGNYQALRVVIGKGEGSNWWCVLFPPLCFVDATHGTVPESVKKELKDALTSEEYNIITSADGDEDIPVKIRFKVVELLQESKVKFTGMISRIFKPSKEN
jgi:stage II sporulation protein R